MIEREDGPIKHYRMVCSGCGKRTKRFAYEFEFENDAPKGWKQEGDEWDDDCKHYCPKCANVPVEKVKEVVPNIGDSDEISDHDAVDCSLTRKAPNQLVISLDDGRKWIVTSDSTIKVEQHEE